jgi:hypothetical protein
MTASAVLILAVAVFTGLSVVPDVPVSAGMSLPSKTAVFSEVIRSVPLNVSTLPLILLQEETEVFAVDFSPVPVLVATRNAMPAAAPPLPPPLPPLLLKRKKKKKKKKPLVLFYSTRLFSSPPRTLPIPPKVHPPTSIF